MKRPGKLVLVKAATFWGAILCTVLLVIHGNWLGAIALFLLFVLFSMGITDWELARQKGKGQ